MGVFSWMTMDTNKSIPNNSCDRKTFKVYMIDDKGNVWEESNYEGYGVFGGKDFYTLLAEMNGLTCDKYEKDSKEWNNEMRSLGIDLAYSKDPNRGDHTPGVKYPNLVRSLTNWTYLEAGPASCPDQGCFYDDDDYDDNDSWSLSGKYTF